MNMRTHYRVLQQTGAAAVELALILPILVALLTLPLFFGIYFWHYTAVHKSAQNAVRFMASVPVKDIKSVTNARYAKDIAEAMVLEGIADLIPAATPIVDVQCDGLTCGDGVPATVRVVVRLRLRDNFFHLVDTGDDGWPVRADVSMRYAGN
jgi:hypothetical protein